MRFAFRGEFCKDIVHFLLSLRREILRIQSCDKPGRGEQTFESTPQPIPENYVMQINCTLWQDDV